MHVCHHSNQWCHSRWQLKENTCCEFTDWVPGRSPLSFQSLSSLRTVVCSFDSQVQITTQPHTRQSKCRVTRTNNVVQKPSRTMFCSTFPWLYQVTVGSAELEHVTWQLSHYFKMWTSLLLTTQQPHPHRLLLLCLSSGLLYNNQLSTLPVCHFWNSETPDRAQCKLNCQTGDLYLMLLRVDMTTRQYARHYIHDKHSARWVSQTLLSIACWAIKFGRPRQNITDN